MPAWVRSVDARSTKRISGRVNDLSRDQDLRTAAAAPDASGSPFAAARRSGRIASGSGRSQCGRATRRGHRATPECPGLGPDLLAEREHAGVAVHERPVRADEEGLRWAVSCSGPRSAGPGRPTAGRVHADSGELDSAVRPRVVVVDAHEPQRVVGGRDLDDVRRLLAARTHHGAQTLIIVGSPRRPARCTSRPPPRQRSTRWAARLDADGRGRPRAVLDSGLLFGAASSLGGHRHGRPGSARLRVGGRRRTRPGQRGDQARGPRARPSSARLADQLRGLDRVGLALAVRRAQRATGQAPQAGLRAWQRRRPWKITGG